MKTKMKLPALAVACTAMLALSNVATAATPQFGSSGALVLTNLSIATVPVVIPPFFASYGVGRPAYHKKITLVGGGINVALPVLGGLDPLSLVVTVPAAKSAAIGFPLAGGGAQASGSDNVKNLKVSLQSTLLGLSLLNITAVNLTTKAFTTVATSGAQTIGTQEGVRGLVISGILLGGTVIKLTGPVKRNTVLFSSAVLTITAHEAYNKVYPDGTKSVTINGLDVALLNTPVLGSVLSGHIFINTDTAY